MLSLKGSRVAHSPNNPVQTRYMNSARVSPLLRVWAVSSKGPRGFVVLDDKQKGGGLPAN